MTTSSAFTLALDFVGVEQRPTKILDRVLLLTTSKPLIPQVIQVVLSQMDIVAVIATGKPFNWINTPLSFRGDLSSSNGLPPKSH